MVAVKTNIWENLARLLDKAEGTVLLDDVDIYKMDLARHRSRITIIPQVHTSVSEVLKQVAIFAIFSFRLARARC